MGFPCGSVGKESACNVRDLGSIPGLGGSLLEKGKATHSIITVLENSLDCVVHGVTDLDTTERPSLSMSIHAPY